MNTQSKRTYITESLRDSIDILTANLGFSTTASPKKVSTGGCNRD